jgi:hypothetical protein
VSIRDSFGIQSLISQAILLLVCGFVVCPHGRCSSRRALIEMDNPCVHARVIVDSVDVVSRLEAI